VSGSEPRLPDLTALSAEQLLAAYDRSWVARLGTPEERASDDLRAELLRRLADRGRLRDALETILAAVLARLGRQDVLESCLTALDQIEATARAALARAGDVSAVPPPP
jgi:hypothetical protein